MMRSSTVTIQVGGGGSACREGDVEMLVLVMLFEVDGPGPFKAGGDRDTSSGLGPCMRGRIVAELYWRGTIGT